MTRDEEATDVVGEKQTRGNLCEKSSFNPEKQFQPDFEGHD